MTHLLTHHSIVSRLSRHVTTGERMSKALFDEVVGAQRHFSAYDLQWQCFLGAFDIEAYDKEPPKTSWMEIIAHLFPVQTGPGPLQLALLLPANLHRGISGRLLLAEMGGNGGGGRVDQVRGGRRRLQSGQP